MISTEELSELLTTLYAAPLEPHKWQAFFDHLSRLTKISSGYLITGSESQGQEIVVGGGLCFNPAVLPLYREYYDRLDPFWPPFLRDPRVNVVEGAELVRQDQLQKTEFYNDLLVKNEMEHMTMLSCSSNVEQTEVMPVWRRAQDGPMDRDSMELLRTLLPHASTALRMRTRLQVADVHGRFAEMALDAISAATFMVDAGGRVLDMNKLAATLVQRADGLRVERGALTASTSAESIQLRSFIAGAALAGGKGTHTSPPGGALNVSRQGRQRPLHVAVLPVPEGRRAVAEVPCALVFVSDPSASPKSRAAFMRMLYQLTPTESRLADLLLEGLEVRAIAHSLGITIETARFHLKRVLTKTGARRQSELMRLMLSLPGQ
jgi:DNA-binding CsgD family transcriptional regulator